MLAGVGVWAFRSGDPAKLLYPTNSFGQICGQVDPDYHHRHQTINVNHHLIKQGGQASRPFLLFFDLTKVKLAPPPPLPKKASFHDWGPKWWQKTKSTFLQCASLSALAGCPTPQADILELKLCGKCTTIKKSKSVLKKEKVKASKSGVRGTVPFELGKSLGRVTSAYPSDRTKGTIAI